MSAYTSYAPAAGFYACGGLDLTVLGSRVRGRRPTTKRARAPSGPELSAKFYGAAEGFSNAQTRSVEAV